MQTILGAGGVVGFELVKALQEKTNNIRVVSRNPRKRTAEIEVFTADLIKREATLKAVEGSEVAYLTVGLPYNSKVWEEQWPLIMDNVIKACKKHDCKLVFLDNVYMYGYVRGWMTEGTTYSPVSRKGRVRKKIAEMLEREMKAGNITALIARAADFYGPGATNSMVDMLVFEALQKGDKAGWIGDPRKKHSFTYTPDIGKALAVLGNTPDAYGQTWHLPTHRDAPTGAEFIDMAAETLNVSTRYRRIPTFFLKVGGWFNPMLRELPEMMYQYNNDYLFDSSRFEKRFFPATPYKQGIRETIKHRN